MSKCAMIPRPISLDLTPVEVAARCAHLRGVVFFDTASAAPEPAISIIAALPEETLSGRDWSKLREAVSQRRSGIGESNGLPHGFAAGYVDYEGRFCFGLYEQALIYRHTDRTWHALGVTSRFPHRWSNHVSTLRLRCNVRIICATWRRLRNTSRRAISIR